MFHAPEAVGRWGPVLRGRERLAALSTRRWLLLVLGLGVGVRVLLGAIAAQTDLETFAESSVTMDYGGSAYTYLIVYPPGWIDVLALLGRAAEAIVPTYGILVVDPDLLRLFLRYGPIFPTALNVAAYGLLEKSLLWGVDLLLSTLLYEMVRESTGSTRSARLAFALWFLNPFVITVSAVHGAYDAIPSLFAVGAIYLLLQRRAMASGAALGAGAMLKVFPVFLVGLVVVLLLLQSGRRLGAFARAGAAWAAGCGGMLLLILWPPGLLSEYVTILSTGPSVGAPIGGFWIYSVASLPSAAGARSWLSHHGSLLTLVGAVAVVAGIAAVSALVARRREAAGPAMSPSVVYAALATLLVGYTTLSVVQVQYLVWILPWLILAATIDGKLFLATVWVCGFALVFYFFALEGPTYLFLPLAQFTPFLPYSTVAASVAAWQGSIPLLRALVSIAGFAVLAFALLRALREVARRGPAGGRTA